jgi:hypothetical protein
MLGKQDLFKSLGFGAQTLDGRKNPTRWLLNSPDPTESMTKERRGRDHDNRGGELRRVDGGGVSVME